MVTTDEQRLAKNARIRESGRATRARHRNMRCRTVSVKINARKLKANQREALTRQFLEAKWLRNDCIAWLREDPSRTPADYLRTHDLKSANVKLPDGTIETRPIIALGSQMRQSVINQVASDIKGLAESRGHGRKVGNLRFCSEVNTLDLIQYVKTFNIKSKTKMKLQNIPKDVRVFGLSQIPDDAEIACAKIVRKPSGIYVATTFYVEKEALPDTVQTIVGVDLGLKDTVVTSDGRRYKAKVEEPERLRRLKRKLARQQKGSNAYAKTQRLIGREYEKLTNRKNDMANKIVADLLKADHVYMQDEALRAWHRRFGRSVQTSVLGRVKAKLVASPRVTVLKRSVPTTKTCICTEKLNLTLADRRIVCPRCGYTADRDIHAARNMLVFAQDANNIKVGQELSEFTLVESAFPAHDREIMGKWRSLKQEATLL